MSVAISSNDSALKLLFASLPEAQKDLSVDAVADQISQLTLDGQKVEGTNSIAQQLAAKYNKDLAGKTETDQAEVSQWMTMSARHGPTERQAFSQTINEHLNGKTYLVANYLTVADIVAFGNVHAYMEGLSAQKRFNWSNFSRWFDLVQHTVSAEALAAAGLKLKEKKAKKEKKPQPPKAEVKIVPSMIDLRVGHITDVKKHPDADALYVEQIEVGEEAPRTVVSGLVRFIPIEQMQNRDVVLVCNLKPAAMRGVKSFAMVLCGTSPDGNTVEFVEPPKGSKPGDRVYFEGFEGQEPEPLLKPKQKIFETIQPGLFTNDDCEAGWYNEDKKFHKLLVNGQVCTTATVAKATLK
ncbi:nucleic acid-binding protein [Linderina pennispora]|uniref:Nucleic acid-binding protein n=1 Tax=Linderina pennispora TaxID=61395 RepID=A0A1Y1WKR7_9FUNG|nr:nucleic acid-binding protein [Linderina pennispora]ORX73796.1 nucleic acid-binding protein [Linderina pennispora]